MNEIFVNAGDVVVTDFGIYQHWSLVSDQISPSGKPTLISATKRTGTVREEDWDTVTQGKRTYVAEVKLSYPVPIVLAQARTQIGKWVYSVTEKNCEHFVKWTTGLEVTSSQVKAGVGGAIAGATLVGMLSENPKFTKFLGGALILGGLAIAITNATAKNTKA